MRIADIGSFTQRAVGFHRLRSFLTALGIAIGVAAVVLLTSMGSGLNHYMLKEFSQFGTNIVTLTPGKVDTSGFGAHPGMNTERPLTIQDAIALREVPDVIATSGNKMGTSEIEVNGLLRNTLVLGSSPSLFDVMQASAASGQLLPLDDPLSPRPLVLLGATVYEDLFGDKNAVGERVRIAGSRFRVVGVLEEKGDVLGFNMDDAVYLPSARALELYNSESLMEIMVRFNENANVDEVSASIKRLMIARHGAEDFTIISQQQMLDTLSSVLEVVTVAVAALGGISLFVGGVGIFTVMTIAVRERTREIGLLRSIGSTRSQIQTLFLVESILLATLGGLFGLALGMSFVGLIAFAVPGLPVRIAPEYVIASLSISVIIGLLAGVAPANHAARLDPLDALRTD